MLQGIVTLKDLDKIPPEERNQSIRNYLKEPFDVLYPDETLSEALFKMTKHNVDTLPVVESKDNYEVLGQLTRNDILNKMQ
jgi:CIC family chloride channel protein